ncbi:MAG: zinc-binding dehydrogenase [Acidimicrobiia bacterium]
MRAAVLRGDTVAIEHVDDPTPGPDQLILQTCCAGICGSDLKAGEYLPSGTVLGHEMCGRIVEIGSDVASTWKIGQLVTAVPALGCGRCAACVAHDPVHCDRVQYLGLDHAGCFSDYVLVGSRETIALPESFEPWLGALVEPLTIGLHQLRTGGFQAGQRVVVIGCGPIGLAVIAWARHLGAAAIVGSDPVESRRNRAHQCGADVTVDPINGDLVSTCRDTFGTRPDLIVDCAGGRLGEAMRLVRTGGRIVTAAYAGAPVGIDIPRALQKEITMVFPSWYQPAEWAMTIEALAADELPIRGMVTHRVALGDVPEMFEALKHPTDQAKVLIDFEM